MRRIGIAIPGFRLDKHGKPVRSQKGVSVSQRIKARKRKKDPCGSSTPVRHLMR
jgi:hypothetical protein